MNKNPMWTDSFCKKNENLFYLLVNLSPGGPIECRGCHREGGKWKKSIWCLLYGKLLLFIW